jgi:hypothetical protein
MLTSSTEGKAPILQHPKYPSWVCVGNGLFKLAKKEGVLYEVYVVGKPIISHFLHFLG